MASGSTGRGSNSGSKAFDFASDDILCSYEDYGNQDGNNGTYTDPSVAANPSKEFHKSRMSGRSSGFPTANFSPPEESPFNQDVISTVESTMKKYADNLMRFLEGISSRLSQLELYCYNLDKSIKEMRTDLANDHGESESKLKSLEKHIQEVHRSVQVLRDKQELADTQKELAKLQLAQKDSSISGNTQQKEEKASDAKQSENPSDTSGQQLALALPQQVAPQPSLPARPVEHQQHPMTHSQSPLPPQNMGQVPSTYYLASPQMPNLPAPPQTQYLPPQSQQPQSQLNQTPQVQSLSPYPPQQQWAPQVQQPPSQQQQVMQPPIRPSSQSVYPSYVSGQPNQPPNSMPMTLYTAAASQSGSPAPEAMPPYGYAPSGARPTMPPGSGYMMYEGEVPGRTTHHHPSQQQVHFQQSPYPPQQQSAQRMPPSSGMSSSTRSHPYNELIEKMVGMGYRGDHVVSVIQRLEESGQPIDFNAVLDRLNGGGPQRGGWSG